MSQPAARAHDRHICPTHISGEQLPRDRIRFDGDGRVAAYCTADTGKGKCGKWVEANRFQQSLRTDTKAVVTKSFPWRL